MDIEIVVGERGWCGVEWTGGVQDRDQCRALVSVVTNLERAQNVGKMLSDCTTGDLSRNAQVRIIIY
jgi:hypothetical protein